MAEQVARDILQSGPEARFQFKRIVNGHYGLVDEMTFRASIASHEAREGMAAFTEKRSPNWVPEVFGPG